MGQPQGHRPGEVLSYLCSPENFGIVEPGVYRSNALYAVNFPFVKRLNLQTVVYLSPEAPIRAVTQFLEETNTRFIHLGLKAWKPYATWKPISEELIKDALEIVLDRTSHPIMIMCASGIHQTGTLAGCLRRLQRWNITSLIEEYRRFAGSKARYVNEQFIELFDEDLVTLPQNLPHWFLDQRRMMEEEEREYELLRLEAEAELAIAVDDDTDAATERNLVESTSGEAKASERGTATLTGEAEGRDERGHRSKGQREERGERREEEEAGGEARELVKEVGGQGEGPMPRSEESGSPRSKASKTKGKLLSSQEAAPSYKKYYYSRSSPLTTENRSYKRKILGKVD